MYMTPGGGVNRKSYYSYVGGGRYITILAARKNSPVTWGNAAASLYGSHEISPVTSGNRLTAN